MICVGLCPSHPTVELHFFSQNSFDNDVNVNVTVELAPQARAYRVL